MNQILEKIERIKVVPVVVLEDVEKAWPLTTALKKGGIPCAEITLRTVEGIRAIATIAEQGDPDILVGAGSVLSLQQCREAVSAGAQFIVSPGFQTSVVEYCLERGVTVLPGCITPTEITAALAVGLDTVKFFPANLCGGLDAMKALSGPFPRVKFLPTGGVNTQNLAEYIKEPCVRVVGGSWLCRKSEIAAGNYEKITELCAQTRDIVEKERETRC